MEPKGEGGVLKHFPTNIFLVLQPEPGMSKNTVKTLQNHPLFRYIC